jgi:hypothetical protein
MNPGTDEQLLGIPVASLGVMIVFAGVSKLFYLKQFRSTLVQVPYVSVPLARLVRADCCLLQKSLVVWVFSLARSGESPSL